MNRIHSWPSERSLNKGYGAMDRRTSRQLQYIMRSAMVPMGK